MIKFFDIPEEKIVAIVKCSDARPVIDRFKKYKHIDNTHRGVTTFIAFAKKKFIDAEYINFYPKHSSGLPKLIKRIYLH